MLSHLSATMTAQNHALALLLLSGMAIYWLIPMTAWIVLRGQGDRNSNVWFTGAGLYATMVTLFIFGARLPHWLAGPVTAVMGLAAVLCFAEALRREREPTPPPIRLYAGALAGEMALLSVLLVAGVFSTWGRCTHLLLVSAIDAWIAWLAIRVARERQSRSLWVVAVVFLIMMASNLARVAEWALTGKFSELFALTPMGDLGLLVNYLSGIFYCFGYWGFVIEKHRNLLVEATAASVAAREQEQRAREREAMGERIAQITRMAQGSAMSAAIAHEISQPLGAIRLDADNLLALAGQDLTPDHPARRPLSRIHENTVRAVGIIQRMRDLLRKASGQERIDRPDQVVENVMELMHSRLTHAGVRVTLKLAGAPAARISHGELEHIVLNLLGNAIEALSQGPTADPQVTIETWETGESYGLACTDNGPGVPAHARDRIFDLHFSTKSDNMGMGLWLSQHMAQRHGGNIHVDGEHAQGARFVLTLPKG